MKIAQIDTVYAHGSTGKIVETIHKNLLSNGHESKVYYGRGQKTTDRGAIKISNDLEVILDAGLSRLTGYTGIFSPIATKNLLEDLAEFQPDIVHLHEVHGYYINYYSIFSYLKKIKIPVLWTLHCESAYTGRCGSAFECNQWKTACQKCPQLRDYPSSLFFDRSKVQFDKKKELLLDFHDITFAPVSNWLNNRLKQSFLKDKKTRVVHNGVNMLDLFIPRDSSDLIKKHDLKDRYIILSVAPDLMSQRKGGSWVLEAAKKLLDKPITFIMIGVKEASISCTANVIYLPPLYDQEKLSVYYSAADVFLITSQSETFSLTCAESLACGTPVLGFDSGGPGEVAPKPYGHFVPYAKIDELVSLIEDSYSGVLPIAHSNDCTKYALSNFSNEKMYQEYLRLYNELCC